MFFNYLLIFFRFLSSIEDIFSKTDISENNNLNCFDERLSKCVGLNYPNIAFGQVTNFNSVLNYVVGAFMFMEQNINIQFVDRQIVNTIKLNRYFENMTSFINGFYFESNELKSNV